MIPCTRASSGCNYPEGECIGACMEFKPLEPRNLGNYVDAPVMGFASPAEPDYKKLYQDQVYISKNLAKMVYNLIDIVEKTVPKAYPIKKSVEQIKTAMLQIIKG